MGSIFQCNFSPAALQAMIQHNTNATEWFTALSIWLPKYGITTKNRVAAFLAQTVFESSEYLMLHENLNYSAEALLRVFPTHFNIENVSQYARQPQKIANCVYANRYGNGDSASDDGWRFSGRGAIMITFRANYEQCSKFLYDDDRLVQNPDLLMLPNDAISSAVWFWQTHHLNDPADGGNFAAITKTINGGFNGEAQRVALYNKALNLL